MIEIKGYKIISELYNGNNTIIYKAIEEKNQNNVAIKLLKSEYPSQEELKNFQYEYDIAKKLEDIPGIIKNIKMIDYRNTKAIILEDFGADSIDKIIQNKKINIKSFLVIAIKATTILGEIHKKQVIHKDIKPQNILLNADTGELKFIDFGISSQLSREIQKNVNPHKLEGTLAYISPEQTGRMNRSIDYRTDYYSLGIAFYEMLTKKLPFDATDPMELVHCHIAKIPTAPNIINQEVPQVLSNIVMKLLEKTAETRYQSTYGLRSDLEKCFTMLKEKGEITNFPIAQNDLSDKFQIPEKIYGRAQEIESLMEIFNKSANGSKEIVFFSGISGIGKSVLINEVHKPIAKTKGYFVSGKYDKFKRNIPYTAIIQAFQDLIKQIITESDELVEKWKNNILNALGTNGQVITNIIPSLELLIGRQPNVQELPPAEAQNRFNMVFQSFFKVFTSPKHPLVLFLDDMQWADSASFNLLEIILTDSELNHLLFFGAYRNNEIDEIHPFNSMQKNLTKNGLEWQTIQVVPLKKIAISQLLADILNYDTNKVKQLSELVISKTGGTPFFVIEFIKSLYNEGLIYFKSGWKWKLDEIKQAGITDNVIELMATKIQKLPQKTLKTMKVACCIGVKFYLDTLSIVLENTEEDTLKSLMPSINEGMVVKVEDDLKFVHDKVREATYSLIADNEQKELHYKIGKILLNSTKYANSKDRVFSIVNQLNLAQELLKSQERQQLLELNFDAGKKAKSSLAFEAASKYFKEAEKLLGNNSWESNYSTTLELYTLLSEVEYLSLNFESATKYVDTIINNARSTLDKVPAYTIKCTSYTFQKKYPEAISVGKDVLKKLGVKLPQKTTTMSIITEFLKLKIILSQKKVPSLIDLPEMRSKEKKYIMDTFVQLMPAAQIADKNLLILLIIKGTINSIKYGNCQQSAFIYATCGYLMTAMKDLQSGTNFIELGVKIGEVFGPSKFTGRALFTAYGLLSIIKYPLNKSEELFNSARDILIDNGDFEYLSYLYQTYARLSFYSGINLNQCKVNLVKLLKAVHKLKVPFATISFEQNLQSISNLLGESNNVLELNGKFFDENTTIPELLETNETQSISYFYIYKLVIHFIFEEYQKCSYYWDKIKGEYLNTIAGQDSWFTVQVYYTFSVLLSIEENKDDSKKLNKINKIIPMIKKWSLINPYNYKNKYLLISAELCKLIQRPIKVTTSRNSKGKAITSTMTAIELYDLAIKESRENGFTQEEAIANECAAKYYLSIGAEKAAAAYMQEARYCYEKWGCVPKVEQLDQKYPDLLAGMQLRTGGTNLMAGTLKATTVSTASTSKVSTGPTTSFLDMGTIMKSSQTLAGEIEMKNLLTKMIKILIENAGAQKGLLILANEVGKLFIEAEGDVNKEDVTVLQSIPLDECSNLSPAIVRYVAKTKKNVVLDNATTDSTYANDQYIKEQKPLSVICTPIINQGRLAAILYLENNLSPAAFTENRIEVLNVLSTQAAISIENARLIEGMKEKERLKQEMEIAERIQTSLVPPAPKHDELDIAVCMEPAEEVGGDYYDVLYDQEEKLWFAIGDVTGHGVTPGLIMMMAATSFNTDVIGSKGKTPRDAMITVNQVLTQNVRKRLKETHFMTMSFMKYDEGGKFTYTGAHCDIVVFRKKTGKCDLYETKGIYLGIKADISKVTLDKEFDIDVDDIVVIYTDGVIESRHKDDRNKLMGMDILQDIIIENSNSDANTIMEAIKTAALEWCDYKPDDDITMVVAKRTK